MKIGNVSVNQTHPSFSLFGRVENAENGLKTCGAHVCILLPKPGKKKNGSLRMKSAEMTCIAFNK